MLGIKRQPATRSVIGAGMRVQGPCTFSDGLQIDGEVLGDVTAEGGQTSVLVIGEGGSVQGAISADHVVIGGSVVGPVAVDACGPAPWFSSSTCRATTPDMSALTSTLLK